MQESGPSDWTVVTVTHNSAKALMDHWAVERRPSEFDWVVVDNASIDGSADLAETLGARVIRLPVNVGFAAANNIGLDVASEYVAFINPDVTLAAEWTKDLQATIDRVGGLVAPKLVNVDGSSQPNSRGLPYLVEKIWHRLAPNNSHQRMTYINTRIVEASRCAWVMGAAVAAKTSTFRELGGWNESYFLYYEDHELGLRAWSRGFQVCVDPSVQFVHGWARETSGSFRWSAWKRELDAMTTFYRAYPFLLLPWAPRRVRIQLLRRHGLAKVPSLMWTPVADDLGMGN